MPAALVLPPGKFFFGYKYVPFDAKAEEKRKKAKEAPEAAPATTFQGEGNSLRRGAAQPATAAKAPAPAEDEEKPDPWANLSGVQTLSGRKRPATASPATTTPPREQTRQEVIDATMLDEDDFMFGEEYSDNDDIIEVDSD